MLNKQQIKLVQIAARAAGIRDAKSDGRYRLLLGQYTSTRGGRVVSCKQLSSYQMEDFLAICESLGFRQQGKPERYFRAKVANAKMHGDVASFAQQSAILHLAADLGWGDDQLAGFCKKMTEIKGWYIKDVASLTPRHAHKIIEALKAIISRQTGKDYKSLKNIEKDFVGKEYVTDGKESQDRAESAACN